MEGTELANQILPVDLLKVVPRQIIEKHELIPVHVTNSVLTVAMSDPTDYEALDELQFATGKKIETTIATRDSIKRSIAEFLAAMDRAAEQKPSEKPKIAGKLRPASAGSLKAFAESTESSLVEHVKRKLEASELYDLDRDIGEAIDLAGQNPDTVKRLEILAEQSRAELGDSLKKRTGTGVREPGRIADSN